MKQVEGIVNHEYSYYISFVYILLILLYLLLYFSRTVTAALLLGIDIFNSVSLLHLLL